MDIDRGQFVGRDLDDLYVVMHLDEFAPVGRWAASGREGGRFEWFAEVCQDLPNRPRFRDERNQLDVAAAVRALERKLFPDSGHEFHPRNP